MCYANKVMNVELDVSIVPKPNFPARSVTLRQWCDEYNRLIFEATRTRTDGAVAALQRETGLGYTTVLHAVNEKRYSSSETAHLLEDATGGQVPADYLMMPLERRKDYVWPQRAA